MSFVFLSHRSVDKPRIRPFVIELIDRKIPVWVDNFEEFNLRLDVKERRINEEELAGGIEKLRDWPGQIDHALVQAFAVIVFWSKNWTADRAVLTREHGAAHILGNVGYSAYIPVLLDDANQLDQAVIAYREAVHDTVQAYNVARYGQEHWAALTKAVQKLWSHRAHSQSPQLVSSIGSASVDWLAEFRTPNREPDRTVELLLRLPGGPAVDPFLIPASIRRLVANGTGREEAPLTVTEAGGLVLRTFSEQMRKNPDVLVVMPSAIPPPSRVPMAEYWASVFDVACCLGPRMLGALLLSIRAQVFGGLDKQVADILARLEKLS